MIEHVRLHLCTMELTWSEMARYIFAAEAPLVMKRRMKCLSFFAGRRRLKDNAMQCLLFNAQSQGGSFSIHWHHGAVRGSHAMIWREPEKPSGVDDPKTLGRSNSLAALMPSCKTSPGSQSVWCKARNGAQRST